MLGDAVASPESSPGIRFTPLRSTAEQEQNFHFFASDFARFEKLEMTGVQSGPPRLNRRKGRLTTRMQTCHPHPPSTSG